MIRVSTNWVPLILLIPISLLLLRWLLGAIVGSVIRVYGRRGTTPAAVSLRVPSLIKVIIRLRGSGVVVGGGEGGERASEKRGYEGFGVRI